MISCKKATELISKSLDGNLSLKEKTSLYLHLYICEFCEIFKKNLQTIRSAVNRLDQSGNLPDAEEARCDQAKTRLIEKINKKD